MSRDNIDRNFDKALSCLYCIEAGLLILTLILAL